MRTIKINAKTTLQYIQVFNGILELTDKELLVLSKLIDFGDKTNICDIHTKKEVANDMGIEDYNTLNNYIKRLKDKGAIFKNKKGKYQASPFLLPENSVVIQIVKS
jgi:F0F1-type ATP synthase epsilon subunit